jgi:putative transposase
MTAEIVSPAENADRGRELSPEQAAATAMVADARKRGLELTGPGGLLKLFTKNVLETALNEEMTEHLGSAGTRPRRPRSVTTTPTRAAAISPNWSSRCDTARRTALGWRG